MSIMRSKNLNHIGIGEMKVSKDPQENLITFSLGSCLGLTIYDPEVKVGGLIHCMLPLSKTNPQKAEIRPAMFVDTGIPLLFKQCYALGADKERLIIKAAGCGDVIDKLDMFKVGQRNYAMLKKLLWKNKLLIKKESIGGNQSRTIALNMDTGITIMKSRGKEEVL